MGIQLFNMTRLRYIAFILLLFLSSCKLSPQGERTRDSSWATKVESSSLRNLYKLNDSIYRSAQPGSSAIELMTSLGIKTILNLRNDRSDIAIFHSSFFQTQQIKMRAGNFTDAEIISSLRMIKNAPKPILVHCRYGADRTGVVLAMYLIIFENWTKEKALDELVNGNYGFHANFENIPTYIKNADITSIKKLVLDQN